MTDSRLAGVLCPVVTPFDEKLQPDAERLVRQCQWLISQDVGLAVFGTNSEANSLSVAEKSALLEALVESGISPSSMMPGTGCCALSDSVELTARAVRLGCAGTLMLPPFYYKGVSDDGLFASYSEIIQRVGSANLKIYLYNIPPVAQVGITADLIERLVRAYPDTVVGIKDSSGDWQYTQSLLDRQWDDFRVFAGAETYLLQNMKAGGAGCISATANVNPGAISNLYRNWQTPQADALQSQLDSVRETVLKYPLIPALKSIVAHFSNDDDWLTLRPPLVKLGDEQRAELVDALVALGFAMPGLPARS